MLLGFFYFLESCKEILNRPETRFSGLLYGQRIRNRSMMSAVFRLDGARYLC